MPDDRDNSYFSDEDSPDQHAARVALWRAVILQAIIDASGKNGKSTCRPIERAQAFDWLSQPNQRFPEACALADLEPDWVRAQARKTIEKYSDKQRKPRKAQHHGPTF